MFGLSDAAIRIAGAALVIIAILVGVYFKGRHDVQVNFDAYKAEVRAAAEEQAKESAKVDAKNQKLFKDAQNAYNTSLANLRSYYQLRYGKNSSALSQVPVTPGGADGYSPDNLPPTAVLAAQCAETTLTLVTLQNFERQRQNNME